MKKIVLTLYLGLCANLMGGCGKDEADNTPAVVIKKDAGTTGAGGVMGTGSPKDGGSPGVATGSALSAATVVKKCDTYPTVGDMDRLFAKSCGVGTNSSCHQVKGVYGDFKTADIWKRVKDVKTALTCIDGDKAKMVDSQNVANSMLLVKIKQATPVCPTGTGMGKASEAGNIMPPLPKDQLGVSVPALTPDELTCIEGFVNAIAAAK